MTDSDFDRLLEQFRTSLQDCQQLYLSCARLCIEQYSNFLPNSPHDFLPLMDDLHKGILIKIYVSVVEADQRWSKEEKRLGRVLFDHIWPDGVPGGKLREAAQHVFREAQTLKWNALVRPFHQIAPLRDRITDLQTLVFRIANLVAKVDGGMSEVEERRLHSIQQELDLHLGRVKEDKTRKWKKEPSLPAAESMQTVQVMQEESEQLRERYEIKSDLDFAVELDEKPREERLAETMARLDALIGLKQVKDEVGTLTNVLNLQQQRAAAGLPETDMSLHLVFGGNPGTGKTTVARIVGQIYGAMGILSKGHLVETDRSGLVAEYAGQTGPRTNKKIDEALDGVLFIDEAYSLVAESGDDPYGREAIQTLLKRMEDDRARLVVILAGYPVEMDGLLRSNPGLSSRFNTKLTFEDYGPEDLGRIFGELCEQNHYHLPTETKLRLLLGFDWLYDQRDEHFGNGRMVRNAFENAIRRLANRVAGVAPLTKEILTTLEADDIQFEDLPVEFWEQHETTKPKLRVTCPGCGDVNSISADYLDRRLRCHGCDHRFVPAWGAPAEVEEK
jgi:SpoVK/Ycf46/Vps4 family AAA+-type ATPase